MGEIEEFVKGLRKILKGDMTTLKLKRLYTKSEEACTHLEQQAKQIKQFEAENRWIPVSERLPEKDGKYLCAFYCDGEYFWCDESFCVEEDDFSSQNVTHWKESIILPESGDKN